MKKWYEIHCEQFEIDEWIEAESKQEAKDIMYDKIRNNLEWYIDLDAEEVVEDRGDEFYEQKKISEE